MSLDLDLIYSEFNLKMDNRGNNKVYQFGEFRLDSVHLMLYRAGTEVSLAPKAVETLLALVERRGEIVTKDELMKVIWTDSIVEESNLAQYLHILRKTLGNQSGSEPFIETFRRRGYRFNADVVVSNPADESLRHHPVGINRAMPVNDKYPVTRRVERRGNVLAIADWNETERQPALEPKVRDQEHAAMHPENLSRSKMGYVAAVVLAALILGLLSIAWGLSAPNTKALSASGEVTLSNLTDGENVDFATISPDGKYFVYASHDGEKAHLWLQQVGQFNPFAVIDPIAGSILGTSFTPDGQFIYFVAREMPGDPDTLYRVPTLGGLRAKVLTDIATPVSFSPGGDEMVFIRGDKARNTSSMMIAANDGSGERVLLSRSGEQAEALNGGGAWSPDGRTIAFGLTSLKTPWEGACTIVGADPLSGQIRPISQEKWDTCYRMAWTRDGEGLIFIGTKAKESFSTRRDQVYYLNVKTGEARRLTTDGSRHHYASLGVTDKDEILALPYNRLSQIWEMDAGGEARTAIQITNGLADGRAGIAPLADGRIAYMTRSGDGLSVWLMNRDGSGRKQLVTDPPAIEELRAPPDGRFFVFSAKRDGLSHLYRTDADGTGLQQLTFGNHNEVDSAVSPDGKWVVYDSHAFGGDYGTSSLWKVASDGGEPIRLTDNCITPNFSPDGKFISCVSPDWKLISIVGADDGREVHSFEPAQNPILNTGCRWSPDGKALTYIVFQNNVRNLYLQPVQGGPSRPLTDFTSGDVYNFAYSVDGSHLYLARGNAIRNVVLIKGFR